MPAISGFSPAMVRETLEIVPRLLDASALRTRLASELGRPDALDAWSLDPKGKLLGQGVPLGRRPARRGRGQVSSGCIDSIIMSLLTRNATIRRMSSADSQFPLLFAESLRAADPTGELVSQLDLLSWESCGEDIEDVFKRAAAGHRDLGWRGRGLRLPPETWAGLPAYRLRPQNLLRRRQPRRVKTRRSVGKRPAASRGTWPYGIRRPAPRRRPFSSKETPKALMQSLVSELTRLSSRLPPGPLNAEEAVWRLEHRHKALMATMEGRGPDALACADNDQGTVVWRADQGDLATSPLHRFVYFAPFRDLAKKPRRAIAVVDPRSIECPVCSWLPRKFPPTARRWLKRARPPAESGLHARVRDRRAP